MFDFRKAFVDHRRAAKNVQCIFTSRDKGSRHTTACHQNWKMGNCGWSQVAAQDPPLGSHGLCPYFYLSAFSNDFPAVRKPAECGSRRMAGSWPAGFKMGYTESRKSWVSSLVFGNSTYRFIRDSVALQTSLRRVVRPDFKVLPVQQQLIELQAAGLHEAEGGELGLWRGLQRTAELYSSVEEKSLFAGLFIDQPEVELTVGSLNCYLFSLSVGSIGRETSCNSSIKGMEKELKCLISISIQISLNLLLLSWPLNFIEVPTSGDNELNGSELKLSRGWFL